MTKILKKSLACLLAFVLCFTAIASCLAVSAEDATPKFSFTFYTGDNKSVTAACSGQEVWAQFNASNLAANTTYGIAVNIPKEMEILSTDTFGNATPTVDSEYYSEKDEIYTIVIKAGTAGNITTCVYLNVAEAPAANYEFTAEIEAAINSSDDLVYDGELTKSLAVSAEHIEAIDAAVPATCTEPGLNEGSHCSICGEVIVAQTEIAPTGHAYDDGVVNPEPTCNNAGTKTYTCKNEGCGDSYTEVVDATGHTPADKPVNNGDDHSIVCGVCDAVLSTAAHEYVDGTCACGAVEAPAGPQLDSTLKGVLYQEPSLFIADTLGFEFRLYFVDANRQPLDYDDFEFVVSKKALDSQYNYTGGTVDVIFNKDNYREQGSNPTRHLYMYNYSGISLFEMNLDVTFTLYIIKDGKRVSYYTWDSITLSDRVNTYYTTNFEDEKKRKFAVDLLNLGTKAQDYFAYDIGSETTPLRGFDDPNAKVDQQYATEYTEITVPEDQGDTAFVLSRLQLLTAPSFWYTINLSRTDYKSSFNDLTISASYIQTANGANEPVIRTALSSELTADEKGNYSERGMFYFGFDKTALYDTNKVITLTVTHTDGTSWSHKYTVESYIADKLAENNGTERELALYRSVASFGASARNLFGY